MIGLFLFRCSIPLVQFIHWWQTNLTWIKLHQWCTPMRHLHLTDFFGTWINTFYLMKLCKMCSINSFISENTINGVVLFRGKRFLHIRVHWLISTGGTITQNSKQKNEKKQRETGRLTTQPIFFAIMANTKLKNRKSYMLKKEL